MSAETEPPGPGGALRAALLVAAAADEERLASCLRAGPDLVVLDVAALGASGVAAFAALIRAAAAGVPVYARVTANAAGGLAELAMVLPAAPDGIWLGDAVGRVDIERLGVALGVAEAEAGLGDGAIRIVASVESAAGALRVLSLSEAGPRLAGIACDGGAIARETGAAADSETMRVVRAGVVLAAAAAGVPAMDATGIDLRPIQAARAARDGFSGLLVRDPAGIAVVKAARGQAVVGRWIENFVSGVATK